MLIASLPIDVCNFRDLPMLRRTIPDPGARLHFAFGVRPPWHETPGHYLNVYRADGTEPSKTEGTRRSVTAGTRGRACSRSA